MESNSNTRVGSTSVLAKSLKILRNIFFAIIALLITICAVVAVVFNFVLTPERMTPAVERMAGEYLNSEIEIGSVDFSLFSSLPKISVRIDSLRIKQLAEGVDDLFSVDQCVVTLTPQSILERRVVVNEIRFRHPEINLYVDSLVRPIAHFKIDTSYVSQSDTATQFNFKDFRFRLDSIRIDSAKVVIEDRQKDVYAAIEDMSLGVKLLMGPRAAMLKTNFEFERFNAMVGEKSFSSNTSMSINSKIVYKRDSVLLRISDTELNINGIAMQASGTLQGDKPNDCAYIDIESSLQTPSLNEFLNLVPAHMMNHKDSLVTSGKVDLSLNIKGTYSKSHYPDFTGNIKIDSARMRYGSNPISLDRIDCDADMLIDLNTPKNSFAKVNNFHLNTSGIIDFTTRGELTNILESPYIDVDVDSDVDFDRLYEIAPLPPGVTMSGRNINRIHTRFLLDDIQNSNYGNLYIDGEAKFERVKIDIDGKLFSGDSTATTLFAVDIDHGNILFGENVKANNTRTLLATANCSGFAFKDREGVYSSVKDLKVTAGANFSRERQKVNGVGVNAVMTSTKAGIEDEIDVESDQTNATLTITPKRDDSNTKIYAKISSQAITVSEQDYNSQITSHKADFELDMERLERKNWYLKGWMGFRKLNMMSDLFPLNTTLDKSRITIDGNKIELKGAHITMGESSVVATGHITNLFRSIFVDQDLAVEGKLAIKSPLLNVNELIDATNKSVLMKEEFDDVQQEVVIDERIVSNLTQRANRMAKIQTTTIYKEQQKKSKKRSKKSDYQTPTPAEIEAATKVRAQLILEKQLAQERSRLIAQEIAADTTSMMLFVPRGVNFEFDLDVEKIIFNKSYLENMKGSSTIKDGVLSLDRLTFATIGANTFSSLKYYNIDNDRSNLFLNIHLKGAKIERIGEVMPTMIEVMPIMKSLEGDVDFHMRATTDIDRKLNIDFESLRAASSLQGKNLVLMDDETFTDVAKSLMFKNKERNMIDSMKIYMLAKKSTIEVQPFELSIDRYLMIVGGEQDVSFTPPYTYDLDYEYNISIIKSPLPFKAGVDITGKNENFDYKITKAKLKNSDFISLKKEYDAYRNSITESSPE